jgi:hypothetical protein
LAGHRIQRSTFKQPEKRKPRQSIKPLTWESNMLTDELKDVPKMERLAYEPIYFFIVRAEIRLAICCHSRNSVSFQPSLFKTNELHFVPRVLVEKFFDG